jgi:hypothetical protein
MTELKMTEARMSLMTDKEVARYLRVSMFTLSKIERECGLVPYRIPGGHRRYSLRMLNRYLNSSQRDRFLGKSVNGDGEGDATEIRLR